MCSQRFSLTGRYVPLGQIHGKSTTLLSRLATAEKIPVDRLNASYKVDSNRVVRVDEMNLWIEMGYRPFRLAG